LNKKEFDASEKINAVLNIYNQLNIKELTQQKIETYFRNCNAVFEQISIEECRKLALREIGNSMLNRVY
jgi:geranylgeranyl diphosphate synthase type II